MIDSALTHATVTGWNHLITFTPQAEALKANALALSGVIGKVTNAEENAQAVEAQRALHSLHAEVEKARVEVKKPALEFGRKVDKQASEFIAETRDEEFRIAALLNDYQTLELAKQRAAQRAVVESYADIETQRAVAQAQCKSHEELDEVNERFDLLAQQLAPPVENNRPAGQVIREDWEIIVSDVHTLARMHPSCVKITPRIEEIKSLLNAGFKVAGVTATKKVKASVRAKKEKEAIEA